MLSIKYLCSIRYNEGLKRMGPVSVVNCFQLSIFAVLDTTPEESAHPHSCCELLSIKYLCSIRYNEELGVDTVLDVVNCFQLSIFAVLDTTGGRHHPE